MRRARDCLIAAATLAAAAVAPHANAAALKPEGFALQQLDALLAPVALYPDAVLAPLLMAATDPLELVQAARWRAQPDHDALTGAALRAALAGQDWDPDVKALAPFPGLLRMLDAHLPWTMQLGYAVANQSREVLDSVRRLRRQALANGALESSAVVSGAPIAVRRNGATVGLAPLDPASIAVPTVDPAAAYAPWPYADLPPVRLDGVPIAPVAVPAALRDLAAIDWNKFEIVVNVTAWNAANGARPPVTLSVWHPRPIYAVIGRIDVGLGAPPLPPDGPVGRPAAASGIPADAIGRLVVTVPAALVRPPLGGAALAAAPPSTSPAATPAPAPAPPALPGIAAAATSAPPPNPLNLAPLPSLVETARAAALADIETGAVATEFARRGAESRGRSLPPPPRPAVAGLVR